MYSIEDLIKSLTHETNVVKHIYSKIPAEKADWKPGENMRTTFELMQYLSRCVVGSTTLLVNNWSWDRMDVFREGAGKLTWVDFPAAMDRQLAEATEVLRGCDHSKFSEDRTLPWGSTAKLGALLVDMPLKFIAAYRLQLFTYAKIGVDPKLNTGNCWLGVDMPMGG